MPTKAQTKPLYRLRIEDTESGRKVDTEFFYLNKQEAEDMIVQINSDPDLPAYFEASILEFEVFV